jgi:hypothetical protein
MQTVAVRPTSHLCNSENTPQTVPQISCGALTTPLLFVVDWLNHQCSKAFLSKLNKWQDQDSQLVQAHYSGPLIFTLTQKCPDNSAQAILSQSLHKNSC